MLVCELCYVKCPRGCWRRAKKKKCMRVMAAKPSVVTWFPNGLCTCRTTNMERHARTVHGMSKQEHKKELQALEYERFLQRQATLAARYKEENRRMLSERKVDEDDGWVFVEHCKEEPSAFLLAHALSTGE